MMPASHYREEERAKAQAREMKKGRAPESISVDQWLGGYRKLFPDNRAPKTAYDQACMLKPFRRRYGSRRMCEITAIEAQDWALKHPSHVRLLERAWKKAVVMRVAPFNVWRVVEMPARKKPKVRPPTEEELLSILQKLGAPIGTFHDLAGLRVTDMGPFTDLVIVASYTGARQAGLVGLRRSKVDLKARRMTVTEKGGKTRTVVLCGPAWDAMARQISRRCAVVESTNSPLVWTFSRQQIQDRWRKVRGDFPHGFHALRHYCATWLASQGVDPLDIAVQLGHVDSAGRPYTRMIERVYDHPDPEAALSRIAERLA